MPRTSAPSGASSGALGASGTAALRTGAPDTFALRTGATSGTAASSPPSGSKNNTDMATSNPRNAATRKTLLERSLDKTWGL